MSESLRASDSCGALEAGSMGLRRFICVRKAGPRTRQPQGTDTRLQCLTRACALTPTTGASDRLFRIGGATPSKEGSLPTFSLEYDATRWPPRIIYRCRTLDAPRHRLSITWPLFRTLGRMVPRASVVCAWSLGAAV